MKPIGTMTRGLKSCTKNIMFDFEFTLCFQDIFSLTWSIDERFKVPYNILDYFYNGLIKFMFKNLLN